MGLMFAGLVALPAQAMNTDSIYTDLNIDDCLVLQADDFGASFACPGYKGYPVWVAEGDLRFFVSFGFGAPDEIAAGQTLPAFNTVHTVLEWRMTNQSGDWRPFATILRWFSDDGVPDTKDFETLIVTKIEPGNTCQVARIDASVTANANQIARDIADADARGFDCATDQIIMVPGS